jgi:hypothetical protein
MRTAWLALLLFACTGPDMVAAPGAPHEPAAGCGGPEYRQLDFWLGEWDVRDSRGRLVGENRIEAILGGCAVREVWTDARGGRGESLFFRDRSQRRWKQVWVTSDGTWKEKKQVAGPAGAIRFQGTVAGADGAALDRTTLSRLAGGRVRQRIERSSDGGATWQPWEGIYTRRQARCAGAPHREFDFWLGEWDVVLRVRKSPRVDEWVLSRGVNRIESILGGCAVEERFSARGPDQPWAGRSLSRWSERDRRWRQTWVDDVGSYLAFSGGMQGKDMVLVGEPFVRDGERVQMRMVFTDIQADSLLWRWERTVDAGATWTPMMIIEYRRAR